MAITKRFKKSGGRSLTKQDNGEKSAKKNRREKSPEDFGVPGAPIEKTSPFYFGFLATSGALTAFVLLRSLAAASQIFVILIISIFLAMGLNPAVE